MTQVTGARSHLTVEAVRRRVDPVDRPRVAVGDQTEPSLATTEEGPAPTVITSETMFCDGSIRDSVPSRLFATDIVADGHLAGPLPTPISTTPRVAGSRRVTFDDNSFAIQSAPRP